MDVYQPRLPANKISPILQAWFLYSVNIYKYDIWNGYSIRLCHYFRSGNYWMINIWNWPKSSLQSRTVLCSDCLLRYWRRCFKLWYFFDRLKTKSTHPKHLGYRFFWPSTTAIFFIRYHCIRKHCTKERISCTSKIHHPQKIQGPPGKNGVAKAFKPCGLD